MKIINIIGGLGNQMFQYALAVSLQEAHPEERILLDLTNFKGYGIHNGFELQNIFHIPFQEATFNELLKVTYPLCNYTFSRYAKKILPSRKSMIQENDAKDIIETFFIEDRNLYIDGYWQHEYYFQHCADTIRKIYTFPDLGDSKNLEVFNRLRESNSTSIHIRRGDYITNKLYKGICDLDYYREALRIIDHSTKTDIYCIFSDDIDWCKDNLSTIINMENCIFVNWNKGKDSYIDMQLISSCKHNIIANSTFSWWGAWLNTNPSKIVIAPQKWVNTKHPYNSPVPNGWIKI